MNVGSLYQMRRYRRRLVARTLRIPVPLYVLDPQEIRTELDWGRP